MDDDKLIKHWGAYSPSLAPDIRRNKYQPTSAIGMTSDRDILLIQEVPELKVALKVTVVETWIVELIVFMPT